MAGGVLGVAGAAGLCGMALGAYFPGEQNLQRWTPGLAGALWFALMFLLLLLGGLGLMFGEGKR